MEKLILETFVLLHVIMVMSLMVALVEYAQMVRPGVALLTAAQKVQISCVCIATILSDKYFVVPSLRFVLKLNFCDQIITNLIIFCE